MSNITVKEMIKEAKIGLDELSVEEVKVMLNSKDINIIHSVIKTLYFFLLIFNFKSPYYSKWQYKKQNFQSETL